MNELAKLAADLRWAATEGAQKAGKQAVEAGVSHTESPPRALFEVESVSTAFAGPLDASVTASQPAGISPYGPSLPDPKHTADIMAEVAAEAGAHAAIGKR